MFLSAINRVLSVHRLLLIRYFSERIPYYIVNEYPKSGGTWLCQMLSRSLGIPFPMNVIPTVRPAIMHAHYLSLGIKKNIVIMWRDGRDLLISWYHHCMFRNERNNRIIVENTLRRISFPDPENVQENLPLFIEYCFSEQTYPRFSWTDFVKSWYGHSDVVYVSYEDLLGDTADELMRIVLELTGKVLSRQRALNVAEEFCFVRQSGRTPGQEDKRSFMRKGTVGEWRSVFDREACEIFNHYAGDELILLGYEQDRSWVRGQ